jgi:E3 ubiquitin-protein ligase HUWE1
MLEKNFVSTLTSALADVDLNYPSINLLVNQILKPTELLTKVVSKVGRNDKKMNLPLADDDSFSEDPSDEDEDEEMGDLREETPDFYRNSALGMYEGELEEAGHEDEFMDEDEDEFGDDDELMDEDEENYGSEASDVTEEERRADYIMNPGDHHHEDEDEDEDEDDDNDEDIDDEEEMLEEAERALAEGADDDVPLDEEDQEGMLV